MRKKEREERERKRDLMTIDSNQFRVAYQKSVKEKSRKKKKRKKKTLYLKMTKRF